MRSLPVLLLAAALALGACHDSDAAPAPTWPVTRAVPMGPPGQLPRLFAGGGARLATKPATAAAAAQAYVAQLAPAWGAPAGTAALSELATVANHLGDVVRLQQSIDGVVVHRRELRVLIRPDGSLGLASGVVVRADVDRRGGFTLAPAAAVARAVAIAHGVGPAMSTLVTRSGATADEVWFASAAGATPFVDEARAVRRWHVAGDHLQAAWIVEAYSAPSADDTDGVAFRTVIAADSGEVLDQTNLTADAFGYRVWAETDDSKRPLDGPLVDFTPHPTGTPGQPRPAYLPPVLVTVDGLNHPAGGAGPDPWLPAGATETRGNHVDAYTDINAPNGFSNGDFRAMTTAPGVFDNVYDPTRSPLLSNQQQQAAITQLFYTINWLHDDWYDAGFTESARNAQDDNYGRGGSAGDRMRAEAQDGANAGNRNNANMSTPDDGMAPRMQVYLWTGEDHVNLTTLPDNRMPAASGAAFDPTDYDLTGTVVVGTDGTAPLLDGCEAILSNVAGKIALVDRGNCTFKRKAVNAQAAGAIGLLIANNAAGLPSLSNDSAIATAITIPVMGITMTEGGNMRAALQNGPVMVRMVRHRDPDNDGALDGGLVAHEYGHYIHHRLSECNTKLCSAMSEGWGDFIAIHMMAEEGDDLDGTYAISMYADSGDIYFGIRRAPYSVAFNRNAFTWKHLADGTAVPNSHPVRAFGANSEVHNAGEVWAAMMWEGYIALQRAHDDFGATRRLMARYIVDGLLMSPVDATMTEVRDAILQAAFLTDAEDHDVLAAAFARRGAGSCAQSPDRNSVDFRDVRESFELKPNSYASTPELTIDIKDCDQDGVLDVGETATVRTTVGNNGSADLGATTITLTSTTPGVEIKTAPIVLPGLARYTSMPVSFEIALNEGTAPVAGDLTLTISSATACTPNLEIKTLLRMNVDDAAAEATTDTFDAQPSAWTPAGAGSTTIWKQLRETPLDGQWVGVDFGAPSETALVSPPMTVGSDDVTITFDHAFDFELTDGTLWDGGVIEISTDAGMTWQDVGAMATPGYTGPITDESGNPLAGRMAYSGRNAAFPAKETVTIALGDSLAGKTFQLRFLIGTDQSVGATGWQIDDVAVRGLTAEPFPVQGDDAGVCNPAVDDGGCCQTGGARTGNLIAGLLVLGALIGRRRRR